MNKQNIQSFYSYIPKTETLTIGILFNMPMFKVSVLGTMLK